MQQHYLPWASDTKSANMTQSCLFWPRLRLWAWPWAWGSESLGCLRGALGRNCGLVTIFPISPVAGEYMMSTIFRVLAYSYSCAWPALLADECAGTVSWFLSLTIFLPVLRGTECLCSSLLFFEHGSEERSSNLLPAWSPLQGSKQPILLVYPGLPDATSMCKNKNMRLG